MKIKKSQNDSKLIIALEGRLDTLTAPQLEAELNASLDVISELEFDFKDLEYISSAGLRVLLSAHKAMAKKDGMKVINVREEVMEVFELTGFDDVLTFE